MYQSRETSPSLPVDDCDNDAADIDVASGDLSQWEYLTQKYDVDDRFGEHNQFQPNSPDGMEQYDHLWRLSRNCSHSALSSRHSPILFDSFQSLRSLQLTKQETVLGVDQTADPIRSLVSITRDTIPNESVVLNDNDLFLSRFVWSNSMITNQDFSRNPFDGQTISFADLNNAIVTDVMCQETDAEPVPLALSNGMMVQQSQRAQPIAPVPFSAADMEPAPIGMRHLPGANLSTFRSVSHKPNMGVMSDCPDKVPAGCSKRALLCTSVPPKMCLPLTAYNYFFRNERDNIVEGLNNSGGPFPAMVYDYSEEKREELLHRHW